MVCYDDILYNFFCCDMCLLDIYDYSICNKQLKLLEVIKYLHHKNIYKNKTENENIKI